MNVRLTLSLMAMCCLLNACVYYPTTHHNQPKNCDVITQKLTLEEKSIADGRVIPGSCSGDACAALAIVVAAVPAGTFLVSGSIVVVGNVVHWLEVEGTCDYGFVQRQKRAFLDLFE